MDRNQSWLVDGTWVDGIVGCTRDGSAAAAPGDSGGPVFNWNEDGTVTSRGIISIGTGYVNGVYTCVGCLAWGGVI